MLGLPTSGAGAWTIWSAIAICLTMIVMTLFGQSLSSHHSLCQSYSHWVS
nr:aromatic amino acid transport family protein [Rodentibacter pneumotropicus]